MAGRRWSKEDDDLLISTCANGDRPIAMLAEIFDRTEQAVRKRVSEQTKAGRLQHVQVPWTKKDTKQLLRLAEFDTTEICVNVPNLAKRLRRSEKVVREQISKLRKDGTLPPLDRTNHFDPFGREYSEAEKKKIIWMLGKGETKQEIADSTGRTRGAIVSYINRLIAKGEAKPYEGKWTAEEDDLLISNMKFDENGYIANYHDLIHLTGRSKKSINCRSVRLRKAGKIKILPNGKGSIRGNEAFAELNENFMKKMINYRELKKDRQGRPSKVSQ